MPLFLVKPAQWYRDTAPTLVISWIPVPSEPYSRLYTHLPQTPTQTVEGPLCSGDVKPATRTSPPKETPGVRATLLQTQ